MTDLVLCITDDLLTILILLFILFFELTALSERKGLFEILRFALKQD